MHRSKVHLYVLVCYHMHEYVWVDAYVLLFNEFLG